VAGAEAVYRAGLWRCVDTVPLGRARTPKILRSNMITVGWGIQSPQHLNMSAICPGGVFSPGEDESLTPTTLPTSPVDPWCVSSSMIPRYRFPNFQSSHSGAALSPGGCWWRRRRSGCGACPRDHRRRRTRGCQTGPWGSQHAIEMLFKCRVDLHAHWKCRVRAWSTHQSPHGSTSTRIRPSLRACIGMTLVRWGWRPAVPPQSPCRLVDLSLLTSRLGDLSSRPESTRSRQLVKSPTCPRFWSRSLRS